MRPAAPAVARVAAAAIAALATFGLTRGEQGKVIGSQHDLGVAAGAAGVSACEVCDLPRDARATLLWSEDPHAAASKSLLSIAGDGRGSVSLCANCHHW